MKAMIVLCLAGLLVLAACNGKPSPPPPTPEGDGGPGKPMDAVATFLDSLKKGEEGWETAMAVLAPDLEKSFRSTKKKSPDKGVITVVDYSIGTRTPLGPGEVRIEVRLREKRSEGERVSNLAFTVKMMQKGWTITAIGQSGSAASTTLRARIEATLKVIAVGLEAYKADHDAWPPCTLASLGITAENRINEGIESLVVALASREGKKPYITWHRDYIRNLDKDKARVTAEGTTDPDLIEVVDPWGTPIIYIHHTQYGETWTYSKPDGTSFTLSARKEGDGFLAPDAYQLWSLGPDGKNGTDDDIVWLPSK